MRLINIIGSRRIRQGIYNMELWEVKGQMADGRLKTTGGKQKMSFYFIKYILILLHTSEKLLFLGSDLPSIPNYCWQSAFKINKKNIYNRIIPYFFFDISKMKLNTEFNFQLKLCNYVKEKWLRCWMSSRWVELARNDNNVQDHGYLIVAIFYWEAQQ